MPPSIANGIHPLPDDPLDQLWIRHACFPGCEREVFVVCENRIWVGLDEVELVLRREAQIDAGVTVNCQQTINVFTRVLNIRDKRWIEIFGELVLQAPAFAIFFVPFRVVGGDLRFVRRHFTKDQFANWKNGQPHIANETHVKLATFNVFLGNRVTVVFLVNERDAFAELLVVLHERRLRNAVRRFFSDRLYQDRKLELPRAPDPLTARDDKEIRHVNAMIMENLFRNAFVLAKRQAGRAAACKRQLLHFEKRNNVLIEPWLIFELFDEVEKNVRREGL